MKWAELCVLTCKHVGVFGPLEDHGLVVGPVGAEDWVGRATGGSVAPAWGATSLPGHLPGLRAGPWTQPALCAAGCWGPPGYQRLSEPPAPAEGGPPSPGASAASAGGDLGCQFEAESLASVHQYQVESQRHGLG